MGKTKSDTELMENSLAPTVDQKPEAASKEGAPRHVMQQSASNAERFAPDHSADKHAALVHHSQQHDSVRKLSRLLSRVGQEDNKSSSGVWPETRDALRKMGEE